jgi:mannose-6-phosphate isomerase-like protein (cupin superfamily)
MSKNLLRWLAVGAAAVIAIACVAVTKAADQPKVKQSKDGRVMRITNLKPSDTRLMPKLLGDRKIDHGGLYIFQPGETAHPEPKHAHDSDEVFIFVQGKGVVPIDGVEYPVKTGDVVVVKAGEDHHTRSSQEAPLVACWYVMEK